ncbi:NmrA family protein [Arthrobacter sp. RIT-PI-e]|uniref:NmrA family NAD(P)-binding protein n=1 Tax=Arthrobacter sp. RIT-PI-e TaxID=1681197 RepID=UPI0006760D9D|nr:NmrA family NAD(P)-binding protein [Arthrobacter sp. RIT-PI-e]KNC18350.1 NmrA family protein [Arthrobacter sp. RIT-PI-e]
MTTTVLVAGATGDLGERIVRELLLHDTRVRVPPRPGGSRAAVLCGPRRDRVDVVEAAYTDPVALTSALLGADAVVSAVNGTQDVILDAQRALLAAAVRAGVPRFIPSDYSADYRRIALGSNRNFELRRQFAADLDAAPVRATSILNGAFTDMLTGQAPMILFARRRVLFWSSADQVLDFTTKDDAAAVTARVALDEDAPRVVEIAGDRVTARDVARIMGELTGTPFGLQWAGTTGSLAAMSNLMRRFSRTTAEPFPAWQGMQYFVSMFSGQAQLRHVDNERYGRWEWTTVRDVIGAHLAAQG